MINKYEKLVEDLMNIPQLSADITQMYKEEYDELFETILTANEGEFMRNLIYKNFTPSQHLIISSSSPY